VEVINARRVVSLYTIYISLVPHSLSGHRQPIAPNSTRYRSQKNMRSLTTGLQTRASTLTISGTGLSPWRSSRTARYVTSSSLCRMMACKKTVLRQQCERGTNASGFTASLSWRITVTNVYVSSRMRMVMVSGINSVVSYSSYKCVVYCKVSCVVCDGVTIGHCCCGLHNCHIPLSNNHHRFCPIHTTLEKVCAIVGCDAGVAEGKLTCANTGHQEIERVHRERGQACFQLKERLERARVAHPNNADPIEKEIRDLEDLEAAEDIYNLGSDG
jgi:CxC6 like cysteine cluster associated with KDZ transposases